MSVILKIWKKSSPVQDWFHTKPRKFLCKETALTEQYWTVSSFSLHIFIGSYRKISGLKFGSVDLMRRRENTPQPYHLFL